VKVNKANSSHNLHEGPFVRIFYHSMRTIIFIFILSIQTAFAQYPSDIGDGHGTVGCSGKVDGVSHASAASVADPSVDAQYYRLALTLDVPTSSIAGVVTIRLRVVADSTNSTDLDLSGSMSLDSVRMNGQRLTTTRYLQSFTTHLPQSYHFGEIVTLDVAYHGSPVPTGFGSFYFASVGGQPWVWSLSEPYGARDWWPCRDHPIDKADSVDIVVTCPTGLHVGSNGRLTAVVDNGNGTSTHTWSERYPIATYLISIAVSDYAVFSNWFVYSPNDSMEIVNYVRPEHLTLAKQGLPLTAGMLGTFSTLFGAYPFLKEKYGHSEFGSGGAMEHQTMTSTTTFDEDVISHELAHQWFGDLITCATWGDLWLNEGFATYSESLWREAQYGKSEYKRLISDRMTSARNAKGTLFKTDTSSVSALFAVTGVYAKGATVLHMLRHVVGDSAFFRILRAYVADSRFRYGTATSAGFKSVCEAITGTSLSWFFNEWVYGESYPRYTLRWAATETHDSARVTATLSQIALTSAPSFFQMPVDLRFSGSGIDTTIVVFNAHQEETYEFVLPFAPGQADIDPDGWILRDVLPANPLLPVIAQLEQNYPNPFNNGTTITVRLPGRAHTAIRIYDILGRPVRTLFDGVAEPGTHTLQWTSVDDGGRHVASGIYVVRLETNTQTISRKLLLIR
jgi:aminopeptidase N